MTVSSILIQNIVDLYTSYPIMKGGKNMNSIKPKETNFFILLMIILIYLLIKGLIVYIVYNYMVPKLMYSLSKKTMEEIKNEFRPISYTESILLVILFNTLFSM
jgi:hypothetical protein